jgi:prepilin-type N-terminal cleavage/methylation domain-containing protein
MNNKQHEHVAKGFTIVELLVVISIIALLVGILVPAVQKARDSAKTTQSKSNIHQVMIALANFATDNNDSHFTTAPDDLATYDLGGDIDGATSLYGGANPIGIRLGEAGIGGTLYAFFMGGPHGVAPYCFREGGTMSDEGKIGYGTWRYPNASRVAAYMNDNPLHKAYYAPKDVVALNAISGCENSETSYCPSSAAEERWGVDSFWDSNMLMAPSSYCISPCMMYNPAVYQWDPHTTSLPQDPMDIPRGFTPPSTSQMKYPSQKTWVMEHNWLQNNINNECGINWGGTWFEQDDGCWGDQCEPEHFNNNVLSEPITVLGDGSVEAFSVSEAEADSDRSEVYGQGLWLNYGFLGNGYYVNNGTDWVDWSGHTHTKQGIRGRDKLAK